jgi:signal peptidase I
MQDEKFQPTQPQSEPKSPDPNLQPPTVNKMAAESPERQESLLVEVAKTIGLSLILAFGIRQFVAEARYIPSESMVPTLLVNDRLIVDKVGYYFHSPERGDIVVFNPTNALVKDGFHDAFIKRIVGLPGDQVAIANSRVYINGKLLVEPYLPAKTQTNLNTCGPETVFLSEPKVVPTNAYLVLGDNRNNSFDGRCWGFVPRNNIVGRAAVRFWPLNRWALIPAGEPKLP